MGVVRFRTGSGEIQTGYLVDSTVVKLDEDEHKSEHLTTNAARIIDSVRSNDSTTYDVSDVALETPTDPKNIVRLDGCYKKGDENEGDRHLKEAGLNHLENPTLWVAPNSSLTSPEDGVSIPKVVEDVRPGVELGIVIGQRARSLNPSTALDLVTGYTVCRTLQAQDENPGLYGYKMFDGFLSVGPEIVSRVDFPLALGIRKDGATVDVRSTSEMRFSLGEIVSYVSEVMTLYPGDIITTGNPTEVQTKLSLGDSVTSWVEGVGRITTRISEEGVS
jgi:2-keto-4-pentenoate hydratase/2-oxohepta-3-ene-1,7-dioic acid hydratase in catechol pathway